MKGHLADQKQVLVFQQGQGDLGALQLRGQGKVWRKSDDALLQDGIAFHTLVPNADGATVLVADLDGSMADAVEKGSGRYGSEVAVRFGQAEFIGTTKEDGSDREQRDSARASYEQIIHKSPVQGSREVWARVRDRWGEAALISEKEWDELEHPRDEDGKFTFGGGGDESTGEGYGGGLVMPEPPAAAPAAVTAADLHPDVIEVGGDEWNRQTAVRLETEYQSAKGELDAIVRALRPRDRDRRIERRPHGRRAVRARRMAVDVGRGAGRSQASLHHADP